MQKIQTKKVLAISLSVLALAIIACRMSPATPLPRLVLYPSPTPNATQTPIVHTAVVTEIVQITTTPVPTFTKEAVIQLCVSATEAVYLRPSPSIENYPIIQLRNGARVTDLGGRDGAWWFVRWNDKRGWINSKYIEKCN